jgi:hypothetical protein
MEINPFLQHFFLEQNVPVDTVIYLLLFPLIATIVVILRQIVGIKAFGIYMPALTVVAFMDIAKNDVWDLRYAIAIYIIVLMIGVIMRYSLKKMRLLYLPRVAIMLTVISFSILVLLAISGSLLRTGFASTSIISILIIITLTEKFMAVQIEKGNKTAIILALETMIIAIIGYFLMSDQVVVGIYVQNFVWKYPFVILLIIPFNIFMGKWTGLRFNEYYRFRGVIKRIK